MRLQGGHQRRPVCPAKMETAGQAGPHRSEAVAVPGGCPPRCPITGNQPSSRLAEGHKQVRSEPGQNKTQEKSPSCASVSLRASPSLDNPQWLTEVKLNRELPVWKQKCRVWDTNPRAPRATVNGEDSELGKDPGETRPGTKSCPRGSGTEVPRPQGQEGEAGFEVRQVLCFSALLPAVSDTHPRTSRPGHVTRRAPPGRG